MIATCLKPNRIAISSMLCGALLAISAGAVAAQTPAPAPTAPQPSASAQSTPSPSTPAAGTSTLTVKIKGIRNAKGKIAVSLYADGKGFPLDPSGAVAAKQVDIDPKTLAVTVAFEKLPQGIYALTVLHDENLTGKMEFDSQGTPMEGYGISNNPDSSEGPPSFDDAKFTVNQSEAAIEVAMTYWQ